MALVLQAEFNFLRRVHRFNTDTHLIFLFQNPVLWGHTVVSRVGVYITLNLTEYRSLLTTPGTLLLSYHRLLKKFPTTF